MADSEMQSALTQMNRYCPNSDSQHKIVKYVEWNLERSIVARSDRTKDKCADIIFLKQFFVRRYSAEYSF